MALLLTAMLVLIAVALAPSRAAAQADGPSVSIGDATAPVGGTVRVPVTVGGLPAGSGLQGYDFVLSFDAAVLRAASVVPGEGWVTDLVAPVLDNAAGTVQVVALYTLGATPPVCAEECLLFTVEFEALTGGSAAIMLVSAALSDAGGQPLATVDARYVSGGAITVEGGAAPGLTSAAASDDSAVTDESGGGMSTAVRFAVAGLAVACVGGVLVLWRRKRPPTQAPQFSENKE